MGCTDEWLFLGWGRMVFLIFFRLEYNYIIFPHSSPLFHFPHGLLSDSSFHWICGWFLKHNHQGRNEKWWLGGISTVAQHKAVKELGEGVRSQEKYTSWPSTGIKVRDYLSMWGVTWTWSPLLACTTGWAVKIRWTHNHEDTRVTGRLAAYHILRASIMRAFNHINTDL